MLILSILASVECSLMLYIFYEMTRQIYASYSFKKLLVKIRYSLNDNELMTNISLGVFVGSFVGLIVGTSVNFMMVYLTSLIFSFFAMIDYNYKNRYNK